jgi:hypothetical protein
MKFLIKFLNNLMLIAITTVHMAVLFVAFLTSLVFRCLYFISNFLSDVRKDLMGSPAKKEIEVEKDV